MTLPQELNPLTGAHYDMINQGLRSINNYRQIAAAAAAAGMDITPHDHMADHIEKQLNGLRNSFFPAGRPKP